MIWQSWQSWEGRLWQWQIEPIPLAVIANLCILYFLAIGPFRIAYTKESLSAGRAAAFYTSMFIFLLVIITPVHLIAEVYLVSMHMMQFMVLICVAAPLFVVGLPTWLLRFIVKQPLITPIARFLTRPLVAFIVYNVTFIVWHIPAIFKVFLYSDIWHGALYVSIFAATCILLLTLTNRMNTAMPKIFSKLKPLEQIVYLVAILLAHLPLSGIIAFYPQPLYPFYLPQVFNLTLMQDQYTGALLMAVTMLVTILVGVAITFVQWLSSQGLSNEKLTSKVKSN